MKLAIYSMAAVLLAGLGSALPLSRAQDNVTRQTPRERVVYVDIDKLTREHPGWQALAEMNSTLDEVEPGSSESSSYEHTGGFSSMNNDYIENAGKTRVERRALEARLQDDSISALARQESDMHKGLRLRVEVSRESMLRRTELEMEPRVREIESSAEAMVRALEEQHAPQKLNAMLRAKALKVASKSPALNKDAAELRANQAMDAFNEMKSACDSDKQRVMDMANAKIEVLRDAESVKVDEWVDNYQKTQTARIAKEIAFTQDRLRRDLNAGRSMVVRGTTIRTGNAVVVSLPGVVTGAPGSGGDMARLKSTANELRQRIAADIVREVGKLGREKGVKVIFKQAGKGVHNETEMFAQLMRQDGWNASGPVLCLARGQ